MASKLKSFYNFIFQQKDLPNWIVYLNYGSLIGIFAWPFIAFGSIFLFDHPENISTTYLEVILINCYPLLLILITFISFKMYRINKFASALLPISVIVFYYFVFIEYIEPSIG